MSKTLASTNLSHVQREASFEVAKLKLIEYTKSRKDLQDISNAEMLELIEQISQFELGRFLIERGGLNGFWTQYIVSHPEKQEKKPLHPLEDHLLNRAPICLATQERFSIFKQVIQQKVFDGCCFASIPCGLMSELLDLDYSHISHFTLHGIDLDSETLTQASDYADTKNLREHCIFSERDAWNLQAENAFDLIVSNGLNIYVADENKLLSLYKEFFQSLKKGGTLVTSFLTPPPHSAQPCEWKMSAVNSQDLLLQKILLVDMLSAKWQTFNTENAVKEQLQSVGFKDIETYYDKAHIYPTLVAHKA